MKVLESKRSRVRRLAVLIVFALPYVLYIKFLITTGQAPVDFTTFMTLGDNFLAGQEIYGENAYYPLPFVAIFGFFSALPRELAIALWFSIPPMLALLISNWNPLILLYAPLFAHFVGGQASVLGMLGLWGYRRNLDPDKWGGGFWLVVTLLKPQLGIVPVVYAAYHWASYLRKHRKAPLQSISFFWTCAVVFVPSLIWMPDWPSQWLSNARPLFERALSGIVPRGLLFVFSPDSPAFWIILLSIGLLLLVWIYRKNGKELSLDSLLIWGFVVSPLVHDYDLIQLIPLMGNTLMLRTALLFSLPGWWVVFTQYTNDAAWMAFTVIAPALLVAKFRFSTKKRIDCQSSPIL